MAGLQSLAGQLSEPGDYFRGRNASTPFTANNVIVFARRSCRDLQRRSFDAYPHHRHMLVLCLQTEGSVLVDGSEIHLRPGEAMVIFPYQFARYHHLPKEEILWVFVTFEPSHANALGALRNQLLEWKSQADEPLAELLQDYLAAPSPAMDSEICLRATLVISRLLHAAPKEASQPAPAAIPGSEGTWIEKIDHQLLQNPEALANVSALAKTLGYSESHLRAMFRQQFQISLGKYLHHFRANRAIALMRNRDLSLTRIAFDLGYSSSAAFTRFFRAAIGSSPRDYRKNMHLHLPRHRISSKEKVQEAYRKALTAITHDLRQKGVTVLLMSPTLTELSAHSFFALEKSPPFLKECRSGMKCQPRGSVPGHVLFLRWEVPPGGRPSRKPPRQTLPGRPKSSYGRSRLLSKASTRALTSESILSISGHSLG
jgi:AraC-like DNA-binding protein